MQLCYNIRNETLIAHVTTMCSNTSHKTSNRQPDMSVNSVLGGEHSTPAVMRFPVLEGPSLVDDVRCVE